jgi:hypothetical protein
MSGTRVRAREGALPIADAAAVLGVPVGTLRRWCREGAPVARPGRRGRGHALLVDPAAVLAWRAADTRAATALEIAAVIPELLADAAAQAHCAVEGTDKRRAAGLFAGNWYVGSCALLDYLRATYSAAVPDVEHKPDAIQRLEQIARG